MLLMIDNYDSFTYNLVQYLGELGADVRVYRNDAITLDDVAALAPARPPEGRGAPPPGAANEVSVGVLTYASSSRPCCTISAARSTARSLLSVSCHSPSGDESWTMPPPACA